MEDIYRLGYQEGEFQVIGITGPMALTQHIVDFDLISGTESQRTHRCKHRKTSRGRSNYPLGEREQLRKLVTISNRFCPDTGRSSTRGIRRKDSVARVDTSNSRGHGRQGEQRP